MNALTDRFFQPAVLIAAIVAAAPSAAGERRLLNDTIESAVQCNPSAHTTEICTSLERDLTERYGRQRVYRIDRCGKASSEKPEDEKQTD